MNHIPAAPLNGVRQKKSYGSCYHGGAFFEAIGPEFDRLERRHDIINADVLDAWFPPSPKVLAALQRNLPWLLRTSPPTNCEGLQGVIARTRGVAPENILCGGGSSDLIFLALRHWLTPVSRVLILDPMYGEYAHVLEKVIGCRVERFALSREENYQINLTHLARESQRGYDLMVLVNPNSPTGQFVPRIEMENVLRTVPPTTRVWIDETYIEYAGSNHSLERFAAGSQHITICKSMSKAYALSGARAAYLCGPQRLMSGLRIVSPPWAVCLPGQVAAVAALQDTAYYAERWAQTHELREQLASRLGEFGGWEILPSVANFVLCHLPEDGLTSSEVVSRCRARGLFLRDVGSMGRTLGAHALRIAVKDAQTNERTVAILRRELASHGPHAEPAFMALSTP